MLRCAGACRLLWHALRPRMQQRCTGRLLATAASLQAPSEPGLLSTSPALQARLRELEDRHSAVNAELSGASLELSLRTRLSRELNGLERIVSAIGDFRGALREAQDLESLAREEGEMGALARAELAESARPELAAREARLLRLLLPADEADSRDAILELRAGVGGEEAGLFAGEVLRMYELYAAARGWQWSPMFLQAEGESVREAVVAIAGEGAYGRLKNESGVHRVQRVPSTQSTGKLQTSTMTVAVLPEAEEADVELRPGDLRIDTYRAQGAGGQHVNTTDSAVRITHLPTGLVVSIQDERSQQQNRVKAMRVLRSRLFEAERTRIAEARSRDRKSQIGTSARSDRIRTYNFAQNRVTDHRVALSKHDMAGFMRGELLDDFLDALLAQEQEETLARVMSETSGIKVGGV
jgi:peptide chain release factor 1